MRHKRIYKTLKRYGFSAMKALEIVVDARRGNSYALWIVGHAYKNRRQ